MEMAQKELMHILPQKFHIPSSQICLLNSIGHGRTSEAVISLYHTVEWEDKNVGGGGGGEPDQFVY